MGSVPQRGMVLKIISRGCESNSVIRIVLLCTWRRAEIGMRTYRISTAVVKTTTVRFGGSHAFRRTRTKKKKKSFVVLGEKGDASIKLAT